MKHLKSNIVGYLALVVALSGTSYAAVNLPRDSVGSRELKAGAVGKAELRKDVLRLRTPIVRTFQGPTAFGVSTARSPVSCKPGEIVVGGGFVDTSGANPASDSEVFASAPLGEPGEPATGWSASARARNGGQVAAPEAYVLCLPTK